MPELSFNRIEWAKAYMMKVGCPVNVKRRPESLLPDETMDVRCGLLVEPPVAASDVQTNAELQATVEAAFDSDDIQGSGFVTVVAAGDAGQSGTLPVFTWRGTAREFRQAWEGSFGS